MYCYALKPHTAPREREDNAGIGAMAAEPPTWMSGMNSYSQTISMEPLTTTTAAWTTPPVPVLQSPVSRQVMPMQTVPVSQAPTVGAPCVVEAPPLVQVPGSLSSPATRVTTYMGPPVEVPAAMSTDFRTWLDSIVDARIDHAVKTWREAHSGLENNFHGLAQAHSRLLTVVEGIHGQTEKELACGTKVRAEAVTTVECVMNTVGELQRSIEQDNDSAALKLKRHEEALEDLRKAHGEEAMRHKAAAAELHRMHSEASARQRQCTDELANACTAIASTRQEVSDLAKMVQRLEQRMTTWSAQASAELLEELRSLSAAKDAEIGSDRQKLEGLQRDHMAMASARIEMDARMEALRVELTGIASARSDLESRLRDGQLALARRLDALQGGMAKDMESTRKEVDEITQLIERMDQRFGSWRSEVAREMRTSLSQREVTVREETATHVEGVRRDVQQVGLKWAEVEKRLEGLREEIVASNMARESCDVRIRETQADVHKVIESTKVIATELRSEMKSLLKNEQNAVAALDEQLWLTDQRLGTRIDELIQATQRMERSDQRAAVLAAAVATAESARSPPSPTPSTPGEKRRSLNTALNVSKSGAGLTASGGLVMAVDAVKTFAESVETSGTSGPSPLPPVPISVSGSCAGSLSAPITAEREFNMKMELTPGSDTAGETRVLSYDEEQLEQLRSARRRASNGVRHSWAQE